MIEYTKVVLQKYVVFSGRARRAEYWFFFLATFLGGIIIGFVTGFAAGMSDLNQREAEGVVDMVATIYQLALIVPSISVGVRRLHDSNKSGWWLLVPFYNLYLLIRKGTVGPNFYGPDPKAEAIAMPVPDSNPNTTA